MSRIPRIFHQTWRDQTLPPDLAACRDTWRKMHPDWEHRLWTDTDNRAFLAAHYAWFLPIYDSYAAPISRADAVRYFLLHHFGGVYVDLDFIALRPIDELVGDRSLVLGVEPTAHLHSRIVQDAGLDRVVGNAFMASRPGHPLWERVALAMVGAHKEPGPLNATGPFLLTRAIANGPEVDEITILPAEVLYPIHNHERWDEVQKDPERMARINASAYAVHLWRGTWWRDKEPLPPPPMHEALLIQRGVAVARMDLDLASMPSLEQPPKVSCLMVTRGRSAIARRAIRCFQNQSWPNRELVIVDDDPDDTLSRQVAALADPQIVYIRLPDQQQPLGELRAISVAHASGDYVAQWDDDDLYAPARLLLQMQCLLAMDADACTLQRELFLWPRRQEIFISRVRVWENAMIYRKDRLPAYPALRRGEDTVVATAVVRAGRVIVLDDPWLYAYCVHESNTFDEAHFVAHLSSSSETLSGRSYASKLQELYRRFAIEDEYDELSAVPPPTRLPQPQPQPSGAHVAASHVPSVLLLTPMKNAVPFLAQFEQNLLAMSFPAKRLSLGFLEGDSSDGTWEQLAPLQARLAQHFSSVEVFRRSYGLQLPGPQWLPELQRARRSTLARCRNQLLARALRDHHEWVLWVDVDVMSWPPDILERLLSVGEDIVVPNCVSQPDGPTYDRNSFRVRDEARGWDWSQYVVDGLIQPPAGVGREYLSGLRDHERVELDAVGGAMLLVRADLHRDGLVFPPFSLDGFIETEGLARAASLMGVACWGLPRTEIIHPLPISERNAVSLLGSDGIDSQT